MSRKKYGNGQIVLESDRELILPEEERESGRYYILEKDGKKFKGCSGDRGIKVTFEIPFRTSFFYDFQYDALVQFVGKRSIWVKFRYADLYQIYGWLASTLQSQLRMTKMRLPTHLTTFYDGWHFNMDYLLFLSKQDPIETLLFVKQHLPELITVLSLRKIPREFDEQLKTVFELSDDG